MGDLANTLGMSTLKTMADPNKSLFGEVDARVILRRLPSPDVFAHRENGVTCAGTHVLSDADRTPRFRLIVGLARTVELSEFVCTECAVNLARYL